MREHSPVLTGLVAASLLSLSPANGEAAEGRLQLGGALAVAASSLEQVAQDPTVDPSELRRRPGEPRAEPERVEPFLDPNAVPPPQPALPREFVPIPDRWRLVDALGLVQPRLYDPYNQNVLKGDKPVFGKDWFVNLSAISDTVWEPRRVPTPASPSAQQEVTNSAFARYGQTLINENIIASFSLIKGDTAYKPPDIELRFTPVFNFNRLETQERGVARRDVQQDPDRNDYFIGVQEAFLDYHLRNVDNRYDFDSTRTGIQPFSSDFRGFLFQDNQLGIRLFGNRDNNRWQYNIAYFRRLEKDTNSGLNDVGTSPRKDDVIIANVYRQDFPVPGFTSQLIYAYNRNREGDDIHFDKNGFLVRPALIGNGRGYDYDVHYLGYNGDGHFGRFNLTGSFYAALGDQSLSQFTNDRESVDIRAFFAAVEPSIDFDWIRVRLSGLWASGDSNPFDHTAGGFDAIYENPIFAGADTSYWIRQAIPLIGGAGVALSGRNGVLASLRSSKDEGQSNFINPGLFLAGIGADFDILPELRVSTNFNYLSFADTSSLEFLRNQGPISPSIGYDLSAAVTYRPNFTQNVVFRLSGAILIPGAGLKQLYDTAGATDLFSGGKFLYSVLANLILTF